MLDERPELASGDPLLACAVGDEDAVRKAIESDPGFAGADPSATRSDGLDAYRLAMLYGLEDVASLLRELGASDELTIEDRFVAACARADEAVARQILSAASCSHSLSSTCSG